MTYKFTVTDGAGGGFNPKCNLVSEPEMGATSIPNAADVADAAMRKRAAQRADQEAYRRAKHGLGREPQSDPKRWLLDADLT